VMNPILCTCGTFYRCFLVSPVDQVADRLTQPRPFGLAVARGSIIRSENIRSLAIFHPQAAPDAFVQASCLPLFLGMPHPEIVFTASCLPHII
jgi:hypothetical protein